MLHNLTHNTGYKKTSEIQVNIRSGTILLAIIRIFLISITDPNWDTFKNCRAFQSDICIFGIFGLFIIF